MTNLKPLSSFKKLLSPFLIANSVTFELQFWIKAIQDFNIIRVCIIIKRICSFYIFALLYFFFSLSLLMIFSYFCNNRTVEWLEYIINVCVMNCFYLWAQIKRTIFCLSLLIVFFLLFLNLFEKLFGLFLITNSKFQHYKSVYNN